MERKHYVVLDGMRGIAALAIGLLHASQILLGTENISTAYLAVDFFFCLSGFVVAHAYGERIVAGAMTFRDFVRVRLVRLYPMIFASVALGGALLLSSSHFATSEALFLIAAALLLLPGGYATGAQAYQVNNPLWSLFWEFLANFMWALVPSLRVVTFAAVISGIVLAGATFHYGSLAGFGFASPEQFLLGLPRVLLPFCLGVLIYRLQLSWPGGRVALAWPIVLLLAFLFAAPGNIGGIELVLVFVGVPLLVVLGKDAGPGNLSPALALLGELSYPFYVLHQPVVRIVHHIPLPPIIQTVLALLAAGAGSWLALRLYDKPVRKLLSRGRARGTRIVAGGATSS